MKWKDSTQRLLRWIPRKRHLRGGILHRTFGEGLFDPGLWKPSRKNVAGGLAVGTFIALTPTIGVQMILATMAAYFLRVNIPTALAACWLTNPLTAPVIFLMQYDLGTWLGALPGSDALTPYQGPFRNIIRHARPLWMGSLLSGTLFAAIAYGLVLVGWQWIARAGSRWRVRLRPAQRRTIVNPPLHTSAGPGGSGDDPRAKP